jgi:hypothetical protein
VGGVVGAVGGGVGGGVGGAVGGVVGGVVGAGGGGVGGGVGVVGGGVDGAVGAGGAGGGVEFESIRTAVVIARLDNIFVGWCGTSATLNDHFGEIFLPQTMKISLTINNKKIVKMKMVRLMNFMDNARVLHVDTLKKWMTNCQQLTRQRLKESLHPIFELTANKLFGSSMSNPNM